MTMMVVSGLVFGLVVTWLLWLSQRPPANLVGRKEWLGEIARAKDPQDNVIDFDGAALTRVLKKSKKVS